MRVHVNDTVQNVGADATLDEALQHYGVADSGVAVALDGDVVPRAEWSRKALHEGATVEVLTAVQGG